jgi:hypothetical protein
MRDGCGRRQRIALRTLAERAIGNGASDVNKIIDEDAERDLERFMPLSPLQYRRRGTNRYAVY